jgi:hypothetical protein
MKMFYTKEELSNITADELKDIISFGPNNEYFYSELTKIEKPYPTEYCFVLRSGEEIFTQDEDTYQKVSKGKMRYDLIMKAAENAQEEIKIKEGFYKEIQDFITVTTNKMETENTLWHNKILDAQNDTIKHLKEELENSVKKIKGDSTSALKIVENTAKDLQRIDVQGFEDKMKKLDKILDAFGELLRD